MRQSLVISQPAVCRTVQENIFPGSVFGCMSAGRRPIGMPRPALHVWMLAILFSIILPLRAPLAEELRFSVKGGEATKVATKITVSDDSLVPIDLTIKGAEAEFHR